MSVDRQQLAPRAERIRAEATVTGLLAATARACVEVVEEVGGTLRRLERRR